MKNKIGLWENKTWDDYTKSFLQGYGQNLIFKKHKDIKKYCPDYCNFNNDQKIEFWIVLLSAMEKFELNFKPECEYKENFKDKNGKRIISRGLFQTSVESMRSYGYAASENDIHFPIISIKWAIIILNKLIGQNKCISGYYRKWWGKKVYLGGARYWAVLRNEKTNNKIKKLCKDYFEKKKYEGKTAYKIAQGEIGIKEIPGKKHNPRIIEYLMGVAYNDEVAWCCYFVKFCLAMSGVSEEILRKITGWARSGLLIGEAVTEPREGDIVVLWRGSRYGKKGHIMFFKKFSDCGKFVLGLGGNQNNCVCFKLYPKDHVLGYRRIA